MKITSSRRHRPPWSSSLDTPGVRLLLRIETTLSATSELPFRGRPTVRPVPARRGPVYGQSRDPLRPSPSGSRGFHFPTAGHTEFPRPLQFPARQETKALHFRFDQTSITSSNDCDTSMLAPVIGKYNSRLGCFG